MSAGRLATLTLLAVAGCVGEPTVHPVNGRVVSEDGSPIHVGLVEYVPVAGGRSARGRLTSGGEYRLTTVVEGDGAPAGEYIVVISQPQLVLGILRPAPAGHDDEHHGGETTGAGIVPPGYSRHKTTPLRATVVPGENRCDFVLKSAS